MTDDRDLAATSQTGTTTTSLLPKVIIPKYTPRTNNVNEAQVDLDLALMEEIMAGGTAEHFLNATKVYQQGAFSWPIADLHLDPDGDGLPFNVESGTTVYGDSTLDEQISVTVLDRAQAGSKRLRIQYTIDPKAGAKGPKEQCSVGGNPHPQFGFCFASKGAIKIAGHEEQIHYTYDKATENRNYRTIEAFSTQADRKFKMCQKCAYFKMFEIFWDYYDTSTFADQWVKAALGGTELTFQNVGGADFSTYGYRERATAVRLAVSYLSVFQYSIREMEIAFQHCQDVCSPPSSCTNLALASLDSSVSLYAGSMVATQGTDKGKFLYSLADHMCQRFKTCGVNGDQASGSAKTNIDVYTLYNQMQDTLVADNCPEFRRQMDAIEHEMFVPLIQATLQAVYDMDLAFGNARTQELGLSAAIFAAAIIPKVAHCNSGDANIIYENTKTNVVNVSFVDVKEALERNYGCLHIRCEEVGGYYNRKWFDYYKGAKPCVTPDDNEMEKKLIISTPFVLVVMIGFSTWLYFRLKKKLAERKRRLKQIDEMNDLGDDSDEEDGFIT